MFQDGVRSRRHGTGAFVLASTITVPATFSHSEHNEGQSSVILPQMSLLSLPFDILSAVWSEFEYKEIIRFRQAFPQLSSAVSCDKRFWARLFNEYQKEKDLVFPSFLHSMHDVRGQDVESWIVHAIALKKKYKEQKKQLRILKLEIGQNLRITWLKIVLGRWCIVAAADTNRSLLYFWEIASDGNTQLVSQEHLQAPVLDGNADWTGDEVMLALTIGTGKPYILIIGMCRSEEKVFLQYLSRISDASHVRYFRGNMIGFSARDGDDTFPYLGDWRTGDFHCLRFPHDDPAVASTYPLETCKAITVESGLIFSLHRSGIQVFERTHRNVSGTSVAAHIVSLRLQIRVADGWFLDGVCRAENDQFVQRIIYEDTKGKFRQALIFFRPGSVQPDTYRVEVLGLESRIKDRDLHLYHPGSSGRTLFCGTRQWEDRRVDRPRIYLTRLRLPIGGKEFGPLGLDGEYTELCTEGFPLLHLLSCIDFDDGYGQILMGNLLGDARLVSFLPQPIVTPDSVKHVPVVGSMEANRQGFLKEPAVMDLPLYYELRRSYKLGGRLPNESIARVAAEWSDARIGVITVGDWTNDWTKFANIWSWIQPFPRWGPLDKDFLALLYLTVSTDIRHRLHVLGEIIPVLFRSFRHSEVIFRIGHRMYYSRTRGKRDSFDFVDEYENQFLGILPVTYEQFVVDPRTILPPISNYNIQMNLGSRHEPSGLWHEMEGALCVHEIRDHLEKVLGLSLDTITMETWSSGDWERHMEMLPSALQKMLAQEDDDDSEDNE